jgi:hypothetical protein
MEKLSSILPSNARTKSVEIDESHPARPGAPSFGRTVGSTSSQRLDRVSISPLARETAFNETLAKRNPREAASVKIVNDITKKFFETRIGPKQDEAYPQSFAERVADSQTEVATAPAVVISIPVYNQSPSSDQISGNSVDKYA